MLKTFQQYLLELRSEGIIEVRLVIAPDEREDGGTQVYLHPLGKDGESRDYSVQECNITDCTDFLDA